MSESNITGRYIIAGGSGYLGLNLAHELRDRGAEVVVLTRSREAIRDEIRFVQWDGREVGAWSEWLEGSAAVVNLAGRTVDCIKTPDHCDEILRSRVESTRALGRALQGVKTKPVVWVQMSTAHIYGDSQDVVCDEDAAFGYGLAPVVGKAWEEAFHDALPAATRGVVLRTSFVLGKTGGALPRLTKLAKFGLGGKVGSGRQGMSWIHEIDMNRLFLCALTDESMQGAYIASAPNPVSNTEFMRALRSAIRMPIGLPAFGWMVRLGAPLVMRTDPELGLYGRYCVSARLRDEGFSFDYPEIHGAMAQLFAK